MECLQNNCNFYDVYRTINFNTSQILPKQDRRENCPIHSHETSLILISKPDKYQTKSTDQYSI